MRNILEALLNEGPRSDRVKDEVELSAKRGDAWREVARHCSSPEKRERAFATLRALGVRVAENLEDAFPHIKSKRR